MVMVVFQKNSYGGATILYLFHVRTIIIGIFEVLEKDFFMADITKEKY